MKSEEYLRRLTIAVKTKEFFRMGDLTGSKAPENAINKQVSKEVTGLIADLRPGGPPKIREHKIILRYTRNNDGQEFFSMTDPLRGIMIEIPFAELETEDMEL